MLETILRAVGYGLCHQLPERSIFAGGLQLPVCARDTGIYLGFAFGLLAMALIARATRPTELPRWPVLALIGLFIAAMGVDGVTSYAGWRSTTNDIRLITGMVTGWGLAALTFPMFNAQVWAESGDGRVPDGIRQTAAWLGALLVAFVTVRWGLPLLGAGYPLLLVGAIVVTFGAVNMVFVGLMPPFERRARRLKDAWLALLIANGLTLLELAAAAWLRAAVEGLARR